MVSNNKSSRLDPIKCNNGNCMDNNICSHFHFNFNNLEQILFRKKFFSRYSIIYGKRFAYCWMEYIVLLSSYDGFCIFSGYCSYHEPDTIDYTHLEIFTISSIFIISIFRMGSIFNCSDF